MNLSKVFAGVPLLAPIMETPERTAVGVKTFCVDLLGMRFDSKYFDAAEPTLVGTAYVNGSSCLYGRNQWGDSVIMPVRK